MKSGTENREGGHWENNDIGTMRRSQKNLNVGVPHISAIVQQSKNTEAGNGSKLRRGRDRWGEMVQGGGLGGYFQHLLFCLVHNVLFPPSFRYIFLVHGKKGAKQQGPIDVVYRPICDRGWQGSAYFFCLPCIASQMQAV